MVFLAVEETGCAARKNIDQTFDLIGEQNIWVVTAAAAWMQATGSALSSLPKVARLRVRKQVIVSETEPWSMDMTIIYPDSLALR